MEDYLEILVFLAFAAFSLLSQFLSKRKKAVTRTPEDEMRREFEQPPSDDPPVTARPHRREGQPSSPQHGPTSLEDILREMMGQPAAPAVEDEDEEDDYELPPYLQEEKEEIGAPPPPELAQRTSPPPKKLADKISLQDDGQRIKPLKSSVKHQKQSLGASVAQSLRNPTSAKRAVILSEILQRKYS